MVSCGWLTSTSARLDSTQQGRFFFHPAQLHFEPADLLVERGRERLVVDRSGLGWATEEVLGPSEELLLPGVDQGRVDLVLAGQFVHRLVPLQRRQGHLRLERRRVLLPLACHRSPLSWTAGQYSSLIGSPVFGVHYSGQPGDLREAAVSPSDRKSTRLNSSDV